MHPPKRWIPGISIFLCALAASIFLPIAQTQNQQQKQPESRYKLTPRTDPAVKMSRGKLVPIGPVARLAQGMTWERLAGMTPDQIRQQGAFPYRALPHPLQVNGGQVFPKVQIDMFP